MWRRFAPPASSRKGFMPVSRYILIRENDAQTALLVDKETMSVSEVPAPASVAGETLRDLKRFDGIAAAVAIGDAPQVSARMYYHHERVAGAGA